MKARTTIKRGLDGKVDEPPLAIELRERGHVPDWQRRLVVRCEGHEVGELIPDVLVDGKVIVDPKVAEEFNGAHFAHPRGCLAITGLKLAVLASFKHVELKWRVWSAPGENAIRPIRKIRG